MTEKYVTKNAELEGYTPKFEEMQLRNQKRQTIGKQKQR